MEGNRLANKVLKIDGNSRCCLLKKDTATRVSTINPNSPLEDDTAKRMQEDGHTAESSHTAKSSSGLSQAGEALHASIEVHAANVDPSKSDTAKGDPNVFMQLSRMIQQILIGLTRLRSLDNS
ncbi:hypothetical protein QVD17_19785 [Tagetes erecta]|uniref:Uncharacterized protein n=1 Tax=Tagetes erecta TaxID=13708 RepID=A0AAD8NQE0_TARER|nr:hypothetical protein QVD17_19785 [Tagetes erecta]